MCFHKKLPKPEPGKLMTSQKTETKATKHYGSYLTRVVSNKFFELKREINMVKLTKLGHMNYQEGNKINPLDFSILQP